MILFLLTACNGDYGVHEDKLAAGATSLKPDIAVDPDILHFAISTPGVATTQVITVSNTGAQDLHVSELRIEGTSSFTITDVSGPFTLAYDESREVTIQLVPINPEEQATLSVYSDDPGDPVVYVELDGGAAVPELQITPNPYNFGKIPVDCSSSGVLTLSNVGEAPLTIRGVAETLSNLEVTPSINANATVSLQPGESTTLTMTMTMDALTTYQTDMVVDSDSVFGPVTVRIGGEGTTDSAITDEFTQGDGPWERTDLMLYVDQSCSMEDDQQNIAANFNQLVSALTSLSLDWQLIVATDDDGCHNGPILTDETPNVQSGFLTLVQGPHGRYTESGLTIGLNALNETVPGGCNEGFLREDSKTMLILVSDEVEQSRDPWDVMVDNIHAIAPTTAITSIAGDYPYGCYTAEAGWGYYEATLATGGAFLSICAPDWGSYFQTIATIAATGKTDTFVLSSRPDPSTLMVYINDVQVTSGWAYNDVANAVIFETASIPESNSRIRIEYQLIADCGF